MDACETVVKIASDGARSVEIPACYDGMEVNVAIIQVRLPAGERVARWEALFRRVQSNPAAAAFTDEDIQAEIDAVRSGR